MCNVKSHANLRVVVSYFADGVVSDELGDDDLIIKRSRLAAHIARDCLLTKDQLADIICSAVDALRARHE